MEVILLLWGCSRDELKYLSLWWSKLFNCVCVCVCVCVCACARPPCTPMKNSSFWFPSFVHKWNKTNACILDKFTRAWSLKMFCFLINFWLRWVFVTLHDLCLVAASGGYSSLRCVGFSLQWLLLLQSMDSRCMSFSSCGSWALECRLSSCGAQA